MEEEAERWEEPGDQNIYCKIVSSDGNSEASTMRSQQYGCVRTEQLHQETPLLNKELQAIQECWEKNEFSPWMSP